MSKPDSFELLRQYQDGRSDAAEEIFARYVNRLIAFARGRLSAKLRRRVDPEDVVQSAYRSFFLHAASDEFALTYSGDLWRLLVEITLNKLYRQVERHTAAKRNIEREAASGSLPEFAAASPEPSPVEAVALVEQVHLVLERLTEDQRAVVIASLQGHTVDEISESLAKSPRTVRRLLAQAREEMEQWIVGNRGAAKDRHGEWASPTIERCVRLRSDDFVIERMLGAGGIGKVYRARQRTSGANVAVKSLRKLHQSNRRAVEQFVQEAEILASLSHPNIVGVEGLGQFPGGGLFIVMDLVEGTNLQDRLCGGPLGPQRAIDVMCEITGAIAYAHERGILHCDLKPGNVLIDGDDRPVVSDFGFARLMSADSALTPSSIGGTIGFMAPEVYRLGKPQTVAADIYGLGALLWTLATGEVPDSGLSANSQDYTLTPIAPICQRCLAMVPEDRYHTAGELQHELESAMRQIKSA